MTIFGGTNRNLGAYSCALLFSITYICTNLTIADAEPLGSGNSQEQRLALVIGNANYSTGPLRNPVHDAQEIATALEDANFQVILLNNATKREMDRALQQFGDILSLRKGTGLFYFSGHGMQVEGENYLVPIDAELERRDEIKYQTVYVDQVLAKMKEAGNSVNIIILDACRTNPFRSFNRSPLLGLAQTPAAKGTLIAYATAPNTVASDGDGRNSPYTKHLIKTIRQPGLPLEFVFKTVIRRVEQETEGRQTPWYQSSLSGYFAFFPNRPPRPEEPPTQQSAPLLPGQAVQSPQTEDSARLDTKVNVTSSGVRFVDLRVGSGEQPQNGGRVSVHYIGYLPDRSIFHTTYDTRKPFHFVVGSREAIIGAQHGIMSMRVGGKRLIHVPSRLAYGAVGKAEYGIPPNTDLTYIVELVDVRNSGEHVGL